MNRFPTTIGERPLNRKQKAIFITRESQVKSNLEAVPLPPTHASPHVAPMWQGRAVTAGLVLTVKRGVWLSPGPRTVLVEVLDGTSVFKEEHERERGGAFSE